MEAAVRFFPRRTEVSRLEEADWSSLCSLEYQAAHRKTLILSICIFCKVWSVAGCPAVCAVQSNPTTVPLFSATSALDLSSQTKDCLWRALMYCHELPYIVNRGYQHILDVALSTSLAILTLYSPLSHALMRIIMT